MKLYRHVRIAYCLIAPVVRLLYPDATEEQRREISRKYGLDGE